MIKLKDLLYENKAGDVEDKIRSVALTEGVYDPGIFKAVFLSGGPGCFDADTLIKTESGYKKISEIVEGELVYTLDKNNNRVISNVGEIFEYNADKKMVELELESGEVITCTLDHEIRLSDGEWVMAQDLKDGDDVLCY